MVTGKIKKQPDSLQNENHHRKIAKPVCTLMLILSGLCMCGRLPAEIKTSAETGFSTGWARFSGEDFWYTAANAKTTFDSKASDAVKATVESELSIHSLPETPLSTSGYTGTVTLTKAYIKVRLPWFGSVPARITAGKMPLSWGFGSFYNSGDILFGQDPMNLFPRKDTAFSFGTVTLKEAGDIPASGFTGTGENLAFNTDSLANLRIISDWAVSFSIPLGNYGTFEPVLLPPVDTTLNGTAGRLGGRVVFQANRGFIETVEAGYLVSDNMKTHSVYGALDGILWLDYNLASSMSFKTGLESTSAFQKESWNLSASFFKTFVIQTDVSQHSLMIRSETLYYPFKETFGQFCFVSYEITGNTSISVSYIMTPEYDISGRAHYCTCSLLWNPTGKLQLSLDAVVRGDDPDTGSAVLAGIKYSF